MFESIIKFFKNIGKKEEKKEVENSKEAAKERLHLVLMQDRANVSADFLELMKQEIIEVIKKYIEVDEGAIDVRLTNEKKDDGTNGAPALYANIPILNIKNEARKVEKQENQKEEKKEKNEELKKEEHHEEIKENKEDKEKNNKEKESKVEKIEKTEEKKQEENKPEEKKENKEEKENQKKK